MLAAQNVQMLSDLYYALILVTVLFNREQITIDVRIIGFEMFNAESIPNILIDQFILIVTSVFTSLTRITELVSSNKCILWFSWSKQQNNASLSKIHSNCFRLTVAAVFCPSAMPRRTHWQWKKNSLWTQMLITNTNYCKSLSLLPLGIRNIFGLETHFCWSSPATNVTSFH